MWKLVCQLPVEVIAYHVMAMLDRKDFVMMERTCKKLHRSWKAALTRVAVQPRVCRILRSCTAVDIWNVMRVKKLQQNFKRNDGSSIHSYHTDEKRRNHLTIYYLYR